MVASAIDQLAKSATTHVVKAASQPTLWAVAALVGLMGHSSARCQAQTLCATTKARPANPIHDDSVTSAANPVAVKKTTPNTQMPLDVLAITCES